MNYIYLLCRDQPEPDDSESIEDTEDTLDNSGFLESSSSYDDEFIEEFNPGYGTYTSCVVIAASEEEARHIHPDGRVREQNDLDAAWTETWALPENVYVTRIGIADPHLKTGVVCADYFLG
jgi:hypothetical protein